MSKKRRKKKKALLGMLRKKNTREIMRQELQAMLAAELKKPEEKQDEALLDELELSFEALVAQPDLEQALAEGADKTRAEMMRVEEESLEAQERAREEARKRARERWKVVRKNLNKAACAAATVVIAFFYWHVDTVDADNEIDTVYRTDSHSLYIIPERLVHPETISCETGDACGLKRRCRESGLYPNFAPNYLPEDAKIYHFSYSGSPRDLQCIDAFYQSELWPDRRTISIGFWQYPDEEAMMLGFPSFGITDPEMDHRVIHGHEVVIGLTDTRKLAVFTYNNMIYSLMTNGIDEEEFYRIVYSYFELPAA